MNATSFVIGHDLKNLSDTFVFFSNLSVKSEVTENFLKPLLFSAREGLNSYSNESIEICQRSITALEDRSLCQLMQFSDVAARFYHADRGFEFFIILGSKFARILLCKLLSTTLIDDSFGLLFSNTEKGIFSFIIAKLLSEMKTETGNAMPNIKLLGVYNSKDVTLNNMQTDRHGMINFHISFCGHQYPLDVILPDLALQNVGSIAVNDQHFLARCGFFQRPFIVPIASLKISVETLKKLNLGDVIVFDNVAHSFHDRTFSGPVKAFWDEYMLTGDLITEQGRYALHLTTPADWTRQGNGEMEMENVEVLDGKTKDFDNFEEDKNDKFAQFAHNIRVHLNVELARLSLTLKDICELREGSIIDLKRNLDDPLTLVVEGRVIGHCTPVKIGGRLGIKILHLFDQDAQQANRVRSDAA